MEIPDLLGEADLNSILRDTGARGPQKAKAVLERLRERRYPRLRRSREAFLAKVKRLNLPEGVTVSFDPYFEDPLYRLEISFREGRGLKEKLVRLSRSEGLSGLGDPWTGGS